VVQLHAAIRLRRRAGLRRFPEPPSGRRCCAEEARPQTPFPAQTPVPSPVRIRLRPGAGLRRFPEPSSGRRGCAEGGPVVPGGRPHRLLAGPARCGALLRRRPFQPAAGPQPAPSRPARPNRPAVPSAPGHPPVATRSPRAPPLPPGSGRRPEWSPRAPLGTVRPGPGQALGGPVLRRSSGRGGVEPPCSTVPRSGPGPSGARVLHRPQVRVRAAGRSPRAPPARPGPGPGSAPAALPGGQTARAPVCPGGGQSLSGNRRARQGTGAVRKMHDSKSVEGPGRGGSPGLLPGKGKAHARRRRSTERIPLGRPAGATPARDAARPSRPDAGGVHRDRRRTRGRATRRSRADP
jgi:hypothetical protein